jgi:homoserine O-acetyltransferase
MVSENLGPLGFDWNNWHRQLEAMIGHDIAKPENGSLAEAAKKIKAKMLIVVASQDHMVNPIPATHLAHLLHANLLNLRSNCGHLSPGCDLDQVAKSIREFLTDHHPAGN